MHGVLGAAGNLSSLFPAPEQSRGSISKPVPLTLSHYTLFQPMVEGTALRESVWDGENGEGDCPVIC